MIDNAQKLTSLTKTSFHGEKTALVSKPPTIPRREDYSTPDWLNELCSIQQALVEDGKEADTHNNGSHEATLQMTLKLLQFHRKTNINSQKSEGELITSYKRVPAIENELTLMRKNRKPKSNENPILPVIKLLLQNVPCKKSARYVRDGKFAECVRYAEIKNLGEAEFIVEYHEHGGRDGLARFATHQRLLQLAPKQNKVRNPSQEIVKLLETYSPIGHLSSKTTIASSLAWLKPTDDNQLAVIQLPSDCASEITLAVARILKKHTKSSGEVL